MPAFEHESTPVVGMPTRYGVLEVRPLRRNLVLVSGYAYVNRVNVQVSAELARRPEGRFTFGDLETESRAPNYLSLRKDGSFESASRSAHDKMADELERILPLWADVNRGALDEAERRWQSNSAGFLRQEIERVEGEITELRQRKADLVRALDELTA